MIRDEVAPGNFVHCWGGWFVIKKKVLVIFCRSLLIKIAFSISLPSIKVPHKLHFWLILLVIISREHHLPDLTNVSNTMHAISCLIGSFGVSDGKKKKKGKSTEKESERGRDFHKELKRPDEILTMYTIWLDIYQIS